MLNLPPSCRIFLATAPCDMRKGAVGLLAEVRTRFAGEDPFAGHLHLFLGRKREMLKVVWWSDGGLCLFSKRLEKGRFRLPVVQAGQRVVRIDAADLAMLLSGIDWSRVRRQKLHEPPRSLADRSHERINKSLQK